MRSRGVLTLLAAAALALNAPAPVVAQQTGTITGQVTDESTGQPLVGVQVYVPGTQLGHQTQANGRYLIQNVPAGSHTVATKLIGFSDANRRNVAVPAGGTVTVDFALSQSVLSLESVVATGVSDPIEGVKIPFSVGRISEQDLKAVPATAALQSLQGKVAGVSMISGTGQPGNQADILLRTPTSIQNETDPMIIVDGVIMGSTLGFGGPTVDLESLDIQSVEIVKGAAAASLYGSRAAAGVISITTSRGQGLSLDQTRITGRAELGRSEAPTFEYNRHHAFRINAAGEYIDADGNVVDRSQRELDTEAQFYDNTYPVTYDNLSAIYQPGAFETYSGNLSYNGASTNFLASLNRLSEAGSLSTATGFRRNTVRLNLDHRLADEFSLALSTNHTRGLQDDPYNVSFWNLYMFPVDVNLNARGPDGRYLANPDTTAGLENPLYDSEYVTNEDRRLRTLASADGRWNPLSWLNINGNFSYDRSDITEYYYRPKGLAYGTDPLDVNDGDLTYDTQQVDVFNGMVSGNAIWTIGDLTTRTTARGFFEREKNEWFSAAGWDLAVVDVPSLEVATEKNVDSDLTQIRANGYSLNTGLDYAGKYIGDVLVRRDGSSLFGPEERWQTYYRAAGAWRLSEEGWWPFEALNEFKARYAIGTAGGRPRFSAQYETWNVNCSSDGSCSVSKNTLGNRFLAPEHTTEQEFGIDLVALDKYSLELTYAMQTTEDQIISLPTPALTGYSSQWSNAGTFSGETFEATLQASLVNRPGLSWTSTLVGDKSWSRIDDWQRSCYADGVQNICEGNSLSEMWGQRHIRGLNEAFMLERHAGSLDQFQVNDDGYVVPVGAGNTYRDGISKDLWGTRLTIDGYDYAWGEPIVESDDIGFPIYQQIGSSNPDFQVGWLNNVNWGSISLHTAFHAQIGGNVWNNTNQRLYQHERSADLDQAGKPEELKKPVSYYQNIYNRNDPTEHFIEDATYLKLRSLSLLYRFNNSQLERLGLDRFASSVAFGVIGRNLFTLTGYSGFDPEVGNVLERVDSFEWPNTRTLTGTLEITF